MKRFLKIFIFSFLALAISLTVYISYWQGKVSKRNELRHAAKKEFLDKLHNDWTPSNLRKSLIDEEGRLMTDNRRTGVDNLVSLGPLVSCQPMFISYRGEEPNFVDVEFENKRCDFENGEARMIIGLRKVEDNYKVVFFKVEK